MVSARREQAESRLETVSAQRKCRETLSVHRQSEEKGRENSHSHTGSKESSSCIEDVGAEEGRGERLTRGTVFSLKFLPQSMSRESIEEKIGRFGEIGHLEFGEDREGKGSFRRAEFTFVSRQAKEVFGTVKRIRVKGLQVKVCTVQLSTPTTRGWWGKEEEEVVHSVKPTSTRFKDRHSYSSSSSQLRFNRCQNSVCTRSM